MKSVYRKILAWSLVTLVISLIAFLFVTNQIVMRLGAWDVFPRLQALELEDAQEAWESGGQQRLAALIARLDRLMSGRHYLLDAQGRELSSGTDRLDLVARINGRWGQPIAVPEGAMIASRNADGRYTLVITAPVTFRPWTYLPYYGLILLAVALLCWLLALNIGSPLRSLARMVERFGRGIFPSGPVPRGGMRSANSPGHSTVWRTESKLCSPPSGGCCRMFRTNCDRRWRVSVSRQSC